MSTNAIFSHTAWEMAKKMQGIVYIRLPDGRLKVEISVAMLVKNWLLLSTNIWL